MGDKRAMDQIVWSFVRPIVMPLSLQLLFSLPVVFLTFRVLKLKRAYRERTEEPFTDLPMRPPGESLRAKIDELAEKQQEILLMMLLIGLYFGGVTANSSGKAAWAIFATGVVFTLGYAIARGPKLMKLTRHLWQYRLGFTGERIVGEYLNQMLRNGYQVFHDLPFDGFNIDHVVVGKSGVFAVETKTRRKPKDENQKTKYHVAFDGDALLWPNKRDVASVQQAALNAKTLAETLSSATGFDVRVQGIVTSPGWYITDSVQHSVWALNPLRISTYVMRHKGNPVSEERVTAIVHQLTRTCQMKTD